MVDPSHAWSVGRQTLAVDDQRDVGAALEDVPGLGESALAMERVAEDPRARDHARRRAGLLGSLDALPGERHGALEVALDRADDRLRDEGVELGDEVALARRSAVAICGGGLGLVELAERSRSRSRAPPRAKAGADRVAGGPPSAAAASSSAATPVANGARRRPGSARRARAASPATTGRRSHSPTSAIRSSERLTGGRPWRLAVLQPPEGDERVDPADQLEIAELLRRRATIRSSASNVSSGARKL